MNVEVEINGTLRVVSIEPIGHASPGGGRFRVHLQRAEPGRAAVVREIDMRATDLGIAMIDAANHRSVDAAATPGSGGAWLIQFPHVSVTATVDGRRLRRQSLDDPGGTGEQRVTAPMPGRVVRVHVQAGDRVEARQGLVVIEAMKMENELTAGRAGRVVEVAVTDGTSVEAGRLLVRIE